MKLRFQSEHGRVSLDYIRSIVTKEGWLECQFTNGKCFRVISSFASVAATLNDYLVSDEDFYILVSTQV